MWRRAGAAACVVLAVLQEPSNLPVPVGVSWNGRAPGSAVINTLFCCGAAYGAGLPTLVDACNTEK